MFKELCIILLIAVVKGYPSNSDNFDVLIFTQHWPQTVCVLWKEHSESNACSLPRNDEWTIHGVWPSQYHKMGPQFCNKHLPFNEDALKPIEGELREKWIDIEVGHKPYSFWKHEWDKHGTCAAELDKFNTEAKYFRAGLTLLNKYDMKNVLGRANIHPGNTYTVRHLLSAVERILGKRGVVTCSKNMDTHEWYMLEIRICFDKALNLIDCDNVYGYPTNCDYNEGIIYPRDVSQDYHVQQV